MDMVLTGLRYDTCMAYIDDIVIFSTIIEEHLTKLETLLKRLSEENLILKPSKCH